MKAAIRSIPDYPKPGIVFRDITTLLGDPRAFRRSVDELVHPFAGGRIDKVAGIEARGFILGGAIAHQLSAGFVPIRKKGKLPFTTVEETYELEYGSATVELHTDAVKAGDRVLLIDDLIATGGTMMAGRRLLEKLGAEVMEGAAIVDLPELGGSDKLRASGLKLFTLVDFEGH
ncbi:MAG: adenine phosphoribosyltransferase [Gammaproteobacteria bacterium]